MSKKVIMQLDTLTCPSCMTKIDQSLRKQSGVEDVKVLFNASKIKATINDETNGDNLVKAVTSLGYNVKTMKEKGE
ncbi:heavy-metal-associated domain-containing protein [Lentilactobacillus sp. SPB1-3]|uniref:Heavy-metal-associated domain-containing protein n=1 Tax=Lentilactobacillus terminaliae TaxID=3003483 RepID=A0ACD5DDG3_9LACO|nr:heavy metal-associated domain-containing protein [Lentilactobacillus sp. SPB1-3]MCZ0977748.1 heavy metal-associated domain-containing protein [Lentilactobacillus sp. SPB1-3]